MAYFSNSSEGDPFDNQCASCKYGADPCPIALVQTIYNYDAAGNEVATGILNELIKDDGECQMKKMMDQKEEIKMYSYQDNKGKLWVACSECNRGGKGDDRNNCASGFKIKRFNGRGCFMGILMKKYQPKGGNK